MEKYDKLYNAINNLLSSLHAFRIIEKVNDFYLKQHGNSAPGFIMEQQINDLEKMLVEAEKKNKND